MSDLRTFLDELRKKDAILEITDEVRPELDLAARLAGVDEGTVTFPKVAGFKGTVVSGVVGTRKNAALGCGVEPEGLVRALGRGRATPGIVETVTGGPFQKSRHDQPHLGALLPLGRFYPLDGGPYGTAFMVAARSRNTGMNLSFHRMMYLGANRFSVRVVRRHLHQIMEEEGGKPRVAVFCGVHPAVCLAAATSGPPELDELAVAAALMGGKLEVADLGEGLCVPAHAEFVMLGRFTGETGPEGPFVDLTGTYDIVRKQPILEIDTLFHRPDPIYHVILPAGSEHKLLMGLPREPGILDAARGAAPTVFDVALTGGSGAWLHAVVKMRNPAPGQPINAGMAALGAHPSLKRVTLVDEDIDIHDPSDVEWAVATRVQPDRDITILDRARGSSLDPSRDRSNNTTAKWIVDATIPPNGPREEFLRASLN